MKVGENCIQGTRIRCSNVACFDQLVAMVVKAGDIETSGMTCVTDIIIEGDAGSGDRAVISAGSLKFEHDNKTFFSIATDFRRL